MSADTLLLTEQMPRVFETAREFNVSSDSILDYLAQLGFKLMRRQMQRLSEEMYAALLYQFDRARFDQFPENHPAVLAVKARLNSRKTARLPRDAIKRVDVKPAVTSDRASTPPKIPFPQSTSLPFAEEQLLETTTSSKINTAFPQLVEVLKRELVLSTNASVKAVEKNDYQTAGAQLTRASNVSRLLSQLSDLQKDWEGLFGKTASTSAIPTAKPTPAAIKPAPAAVKPASVSPRKYTRLPKGSLSTNEQYFKPILQALESLNGEAARANVIEKVDELMEGVLTDYDRQPPPSHPNIPRWHIKIDKVRARMISERLLVKSAHTGYWKISGAGKEYLKKN